MKIVFEITGEFEDPNLTINEAVDCMTEAAEKLREMGEARARYRIIIDEKKWINL